MVHQRERAHGLAARLTLGDPFLEPIPYNVGIDGLAQRKWDDAGFDVVRLDDLLNALGKEAVYGNTDTRMGWDQAADAGIQRAAPRAGHQHNILLCLKESA